jgi:molecular chaperone DnaK
VEVTFDIDANGILDVRAKDRATNREQTVRITASSMLSKDDVDRMVRDAQEHAEEDRQRRDEVETRNQADALAFQGERTIRDLGDKVSSEDKAEVEGKVEQLREALKGDDLERIRTLTSELAASLQRVGTAAYQATGDQGGNGFGPEGEPAGAGAGEGADGNADAEEAVEGEYKEV